MSSPSGPSRLSREDLQVEMNKSLHLTLAKTVGTSDRGVRRFSDEVHSEILEDELSAANLLDDLRALARAPGELDCDEENDDLGNAPFPPGHSNAPATSLIAALITDSSANRWTLVLRVIAREVSERVSILSVYSNDSLPRRTYRNDGVSWVGLLRAVFSRIEGDENDFRMQLLLPRPIACLVPSRDVDRVVSHSPISKLEPKMSMKSNTSVLLSCIEAQRVRLAQQAALLPNSLVLCMRLLHNSREGWPGVVPSICSGTQCCPADKGSTDTWTLDRINEALAALTTGSRFTLNAVQVADVRPTGIGRHPKPTTFGDTRSAPSERVSRPLTVTHIGFR